jgi:hypothetical protein
MWKKVKLEYNSFKPSKGVFNFFYKPSYNNNIIQFCSKSYGEYLEKIYGDVPSRLNPIILRVVDENQTISTDLLIDRFNTNKLEEILNNGGDCYIQMEYNKNVLLPKLKYGKIVLSLTQPS